MQRRSARARLKPAILPLLLSPAMLHAEPVAENVLVTRLDLIDPASITAAVAEAEARFGAIDVLLNNVELAADEEAYLTFNTDLGAEGRGIDIYGIRVRQNQ